jgi:hypothetical protein
MTVTYHGLFIVCLILGVILLNPVLLIAALVFWFLSRNTVEVTPK